MNAQLTDHDSLHHDDCNFYEAPEEFIMDEENELSDHDFAEAPQISSEGHVTEHSDPQRLPHSPKNEDDLHAQKGSSSNIPTSEHGDQKSLVEETKETSQIPQDQQQQQFPPVKMCSHPHLKEELVGKMTEENIEHTSTDHEGKALQKVDDAGNSQGVTPFILCSPGEEQQSDPKNLVEEIKEASIPSQIPQDQQQQQSPLVKMCSDPYLKEEQVGKMMEENIEHPTTGQEGKTLEEVDDAGNSQGVTPLFPCSPLEEQLPPEMGKKMEEDIEHPTAENEGKVLQEVDDGGNSHSINNIKLAVEEHGATPPILCSPVEEQKGDPKNLVEEVKEASIPSKNPQDQQPPEVGQMMEEVIEHPTVDHETKTLQEVDDADNSLSIDNIKSSVEEQGAMPPILCSPEKEQQSDPKGLVEETKEAAIPSQIPQNQQQQQSSEVGQILEEDNEYPTEPDHEGKTLQEADDAYNLHSINIIKSAVEEQGATPPILCSPVEEQQSDPKNLVEEIKEASIPSKNPQDQQQQQPPEVGQMMEEDMGQMMEGDIEHPTSDHERKTLQEVDDADNSHSINIIKSAVEEQGATPLILNSPVEEQRSDPKNLVEEIEEASIPSKNPQDQQQRQPPEAGQMMEEDIEADHEVKTLQEVDDTHNSHSINIIKLAVEEQGATPPILWSPVEEQQSDPKNFVEEIKEASIPSKNPQDQQQQQLPEAGKMMEEDIEHPTADHERKTLQEVDDADNSHSINNIKSTVEEQGATPPILCSPVEEQQSDPKNLVEEIKEASIPSKNPQDQQQQQPPEAGKMMEENMEHLTANHEVKTLQEVFDDADNSHSINNIKPAVEEQGATPPILCSPEQQSDSKNLVDEIKEASIPSKNPQDQQQQQLPPIERLCSDHPRLEEEKVGKGMAEDLREHQTVNRDDKPPQEAVPAVNFHSCDDIKSTEALRPPDSEAEEQNSVEKAILPNSGDPGGKNDKRAIDRSHNLHPKGIICASRLLLSVMVSSFALVVLRKIFR